MDAYQNLISGDKSPWDGQSVISVGCQPNTNIIRKTAPKIKILLTFLCTDYFTALHRTVTRLLPPDVQVYSDKSNPLVIISSVAFPGSVSKRTTS